MSRSLDPAFSPLRKRRLRNERVLPSLFMAKFKAARGRKSASPARPPAAVSCVVIVLIALVLGMIFLYEVMKHANG
jgi:hypothetical protein